ncbi:3-deoxy-manno-octulosonate cytidylyltransferase [Helicobacter cappadocius]|uniref:3-deoxy-manno-octulosonate cytidylyltransferase n=1 Tax=Helicobacter cappadocius TaxID=3063998 RepID=A0AA90T4T9_9HELI|nr:MULTISPECIES: 3-deoxy-manno-octulosonate cytidylyltransferase [unclassified Helicobacter]MDO7253156.1 3-deoxy-manno-octulosonate cytidylyltransferase [Helicobacter sp. faydin-H75]MDP2538718.1 3-deoxy-manno-octulosonate cytidylyltransferase [Helicobacter sp. faydin-H76]
MIIIPARLHSSRFPKKILTDICGTPMLIKTAENAQKVDEVVIACDDSEVLEICKKYHFKALLTNPMHTSGTDRCAEVCRILKLKDDEIIINVQADEPFLERKVISSLIDSMKEASFMATCAKIIDKSEISDTNLVKVILNVHKEAIYFSRLPIPYSRDGIENPLLQTNPYYGHLGIYGFYSQTLQEFCQLPKSPLEDIEKLEQLRAIYHKKSILIKIVQSKSIGIDTPNDLQKALELISQTQLHDSL